MCCVDSHMTFRHPYKEGYRGHYIGYRGWFPHVCSDCSYIASNLLLFIPKEGTSYRILLCFVY